MVDSTNQLVSVGETGEILIRSPYLSQGYWGDPALTEAKFIANPFTGAAGDRCYRTGDLGTYLPMAAPVSWGAVTTRSKSVAIASSWRKSRTPLPVTRSSANAWW